jgi:hypothetical protein
MSASKGCAAKEAELGSDELITTEDQRGDEGSEGGRRKGGRLTLQL